MRNKMSKLLSVLLTLVLLLSLAGPLAPSARAEGPYKVSLDDSFHGSVTADKDMADEGETVRLTVTPSAGYIIESISVYAINLHTTVPTTYSEGNYVFTMPASEVQASATFRPAAPTTTEIPSVGLALTLPAAGGSYSGSATASITSGTGFTLTGAKWFNGGTPETNPGCGLAPSSFEAGKPYFAEIYLTAEDGYGFTESTAVTLTGGATVKSTARDHGITTLTIVTNDYTIPAAAATTYTITVNGGKAYKAGGVEITSAAEGDSVYILFDDDAAPAGKYIEWGSAVTEPAVSISAGMISGTEYQAGFIMPAANITVSPDYLDQKSLTVDLTGGTSTDTSAASNAVWSLYRAEDLGLITADISDSHQEKFDLDKDGSWDVTYSTNDSKFSVQDSCSVTGDKTLTIPAAEYSPITFLFKAAAVPYTVDLSTGKMDLATGQEFADLFNSLGAWTHMSSTSGSSTYYYDLDKDGTEDISVTNSSSSRNVLLLTTSNITTDTYVISDSTGPYNPITFILKAPTVTTYTVTLIAYDKTNGTEQAGGEVAFSDSGKGTRISGDYEGNSSRTVGVYPASDYTFAGWAKGSPSGEIVSTSSPYTFTVTEDVTLYALFEKITTYPVWVGGVQVTSANKDDILGDGTFTYDHDSQTLTVNKRVEKAVVIKAEEDLNVANGGIGSTQYLFAANVTFEMSGYDLAINSGIAAVSSNGVCKITAKNVTVTTSTEYYMFNKADISAEDTLTLTCENGTVGAGGSFRAKTINITANKGYSVFHQDAMITALGGDVTIINNGAGGYINSFKFTLTGANNVTIETNGGGSGYVFGSSSSNVVVEASGTLMLTNNSGTIGGGSFTGKDIIVTANRGYSVFHNDATITALGGDVTIKNNAENGYIASHDLKITGAKDVSIWADCNGSSILNGGATISASGAVEITNKGGWVTYDAALDITAGTTVLLLTQADNPVVGGTLTYNVGGKAALGYTDPSATTGGVEIPSGTVPDSSYRKITIGEPASVTEYPVWVGGVQVTSANKDDILGDGKVSYTPGEGSGTLTITGTPAITGLHENALIYADGVDLTINAASGLTLNSAGSGVYVRAGGITIGGNATITSDGYALYSGDGSVTVNGDADLTTGSNGYPVYSWKGGVTITGNLTAETSSYDVIYAYGGDINIGGSVDAKTTKADGDGLRAMGDITIGGNATITSDGYALYSGDGSVTVGGNADLTTGSNGYPVYSWNGGVTITGNLTAETSSYDVIYAYGGDISIGGSVDAKTTKADGDGLRASSGNISIGGAATVTAGGYALYSGDGSVTVGGNADLTTGNGYPVYSWNGGVTITGNLTAETSSYDVIYAYGGDISIGGSVDAKTTKADGNGLYASNGKVVMTSGVWDITAGNYAIYAKNGIEIPGTHEVTTPTGGMIAQVDGVYTVTEADGTTIAKHAIIEPGEEKYPVWVGGVQVTSANKDDILGDGGKAKFDPSTNTLTLNNPTISGAYHNAAVYAEVDLTITGSATLSKTILVNAKDLTLDANIVIATPGWDSAIVAGNITVNGGSIIASADEDALLAGSSITINDGSVVGNECDLYAGSITIAGGTVNVSDGLFGIYSKNDITISGGTVTAKGNDYGIYAGGSVTISGGSVTATGSECGISAAHGDVTISGGTVTAKSDTVGIEATNGTIKIQNGTTSVTADGAGAAIGAGGITIGDEMMIKEPAGGFIGDITGSRVIKNPDDTTATHAVIVPKEAATHTVTFEANGGTPVPAAQTVADGGKATKPADPTKPGVSFGGWYKDEFFTEAFDFNTPITGNITLYAKWIQYVYILEVVKVWEDDDDAAGKRPDFVDVKILANGTETDTVMLTKDEGWKKLYVMATGEADLVLTCEEIVPESYTLKDMSRTGNTVTLTNQYTGASPAPTTYTVTFETNGGSAVASQTVNSGEKATKPADPTKSGFVFDGWYADATFAAAFDFDTPVTADVTVYAKWTEESKPGEIVYTIVSGGNSTWTKGSSSGVTIVVKRDPNDEECFSHFTSVQIDGTALVNGTDYTAVAGSTVITLNASALQKLTTGTKTVTINFDDGKATTSLIIKAGSSGTSGGTSPRTGDNSNPGLWITVMVLSGLGLGGLVVTDKKRRYLSRH